MDDSGSSTLNSCTKRQQYKSVDETDIDDQVLECASNEGEDSEDIYGDIDWEEGDQVSKLASTKSVHNNNVNGSFDNSCSQLVINPDHVSCYSM